MRFVVENKYKDTNLEYFKLKTIYTARKIIMLYPMGAAEQNLNLLLFDKYKKTLKQICTSLILSCSINSDNTDKLFINFDKSEDDELASFITYGNLETSGSAILQTAFGQI